MKKLLSYFLLAGGILAFSACGDDDDGGSDNGVTITGIPETAVIGPGETLGPVQATVSAPDGLDQLIISRNGTVLQTVQLSGTSQTHDFSYTAQPEDEGTNVVFLFTVTDVDGDNAVATHILTVTSDPTDIVVSQNISSDVTWTTGQTVTLASRIAVLDGATLTIEPGVVIKGQEGQAANATALLIARGGKIMAEGTAELPIIMTTVADAITPADIAAGNVGSPNLTADVRGRWGGLIVCGNAPISVQGDVESAQIEGIPPSDPNGLYGGTDPADNSGVIRYVSIRHGGTDLQDGDEINGLTLGGVGSGTVVDHVEIVANDDDGIEFFGGTVDDTNILVWAQSDDAFDVDQGYSGTVDNFVYVRGFVSDHGLELDGIEGSVLADSQFTLTNGSLKGFWEDGNPPANGEYADFRDGVRANVTNVYAFNFWESADIELDGNAEAANWLAGLITMTGWEINTSHLSSGNTTIDAIFKDNSDAGTAFTVLPPGATIVSGAPTVGADMTQFEWTWAQEAGGLDDF